MGQNSQPLSSSVFSIDVSSESKEDISDQADKEGSNTEELLQQLVLGQERQNELLEEMLDSLSASQRSRSIELGHWKQANPALADRCRKAAEVLSEVQTEFLDTLTEEIDSNSDTLLAGDFMMNEFVDRFGPRLAHLNGVLQVLSQLSASPSKISD